MKRIIIPIVALSFVFGFALQDAYAGKVARRLPVIRMGKVERQKPVIRVAAADGKPNGKQSVIDGKADGKDGKGDGKTDGKDGKIGEVPPPSLVRPPPAPLDGDCRGKEKKGLASLWPEEQKVCGDFGWLFPGLIWGECGLRICILKGPKGQSAFGPTEF